MEERPIAYGLHVANRLRLYQLSQDALISVIREPDSIELGADGKTNAVKVFPGRLRPFRAIYTDDQRHIGAFCGQLL